MQDDSTTTYRVARYRLLLGRQPPHGMGRALCARGGAAPLSPEGFLLPPTERYTQITSNHKKQLLQLAKNISPTRKIEKHTPANLANPANIGLGTERVRSWYGEGLGSSPLFYFVLTIIFHCSISFYFVLVVLKPR